MAMAGCGVVLVVLVGMGSLLANLWLRISTQAQKDEAQLADVIIVLGSAVWPGERPSPSLESRVQRGVALYHLGMAEHLFLSGGVGRYPPAEAEVMRRVAVSLGVPEQSLILDTESGSTIESIQRASSTMLEHDWKTAIIVSDPFHIYRALIMAKDEGILAWGSPASDSPTHTIPRLRNYYTFREVAAIAWYQVARLF